MSEIENLKKQLQLQEQAINELFSTTKYTNDRIDVIQQLLISTTPIEPIKLLHITEAMRDSLKNSNHVMCINKIQKQLKELTELTEQISK